MKEKKRKMKMYEGKRKFLHGWKNFVISSYFPKKEANKCESFVTKKRSSKWNFCAVELERRNRKLLI